MPPSAGPAAERLEANTAGGPRCSPAGCSFLRVVGRALIVVALAGLIGVADSARRPVQLSLKPNPVIPTSGNVPTDLPLPTTDPAATGQPAPDQPVPVGGAEAGASDTFIDLAQAKRFYDSLEADFIDAREPAQFRPGHIPGAYNLTQADFLGSVTPEALEYLDPARSVVIYCDGGDCHASENVAILLQQAGFTSIRIMTDGFPAWVAAGYDVESSPEGAGTGGGD